MLVKLPKANSTEKKSLTAKLYCKTAHLILSATGQYYGLALFYLDIFVSAIGEICQEIVL